jgi:hypothetical protein
MHIPCIILAPVNNMVRHTVFTGARVVYEPWVLCMHNLLCLRVRETIGTANIILRVSGGFHGLQLLSRLVRSRTARTCSTLFLSGLVCCSGMV